jgi:hypothetical protein
LLMSRQIRRTFSLMEPSTFFIPSAGADKFRKELLRAASTRCHYLIHPQAFFGNSKCRFTLSRKPLGRWR